MPDYSIKSADPISRLIKSEGIKSWNKLIDYVHKLPYGRNRNRSDVKLVIIERKGTCSSKHAFLKTVADLNDIPDVKLFLGIYKMNARNTSKLADLFSEMSLDCIPEAHCYLKIDGEPKDVTFPDSNWSKIGYDMIEEQEITPEQVDDFKIGYHKEFLKKWLVNERLNLSFEELWSARERCIECLSA